LGLVFSAIEIRATEKMRQRGVNENAKV